MRFLFILLFITSAQAADPCVDYYAVDEKEELPAYLFPIVDFCHEVAELGYNVKTAYVRGSNQITIEPRTWDEDHIILMTDNLCKMRDRVGINVHFEVPSPMDFLAAGNKSEVISTDQLRSWLICK